MISFFTVSAIFGYLIIFKKRAVNLTYTQWIAVFLSIVVFIIIPLLDRNRFSSYATLICFLLVCVLKESEKNYTILYITNFLSAIIIFSLPLWLFHTFISQLPLYNVIDLTAGKGALQDVLMKNYFFFVTDYDFDYQRFYSVFDEPGVLGTLASFVLFANKYNFNKKPLIFILIGGIFTYSLAFYILTIAGFCFSFMKVKQSDLPRISIIIIIISLLVFTIKDSDMFEGLISDRFKSIDQQVHLRTHDQLNIFFDTFISSIDAVYGKGTSFISTSNLITGSSYKLFIIEYGMLGVVALLMLYYSLIRSNRVYSYFLLIFFILSFMQRPGAFSSWQLIMFTCSLSYLNSKHKQKVIKRKIQ